MKSPFHTSLHKIFKNCLYEVNLASQRSYLKVLLLSKFWSERRAFNWCRLWTSQIFPSMLRCYLSPDRHFYSVWLWPCCALETQLKKLMAKMKIYITGDPWHLRISLQIFPRFKKCTNLLKICHVHGQISGVYCWASLTDQMVYEMFSLKNIEKNKYDIVDPSKSISP